MPTYEDLREYFDENEVLTNLVRAAAEVPIVRGFTLDVNPTWATCYDLDDGLGPPRAASDSSPEYCTPQPFQGYRRRDLRRVPTRWSMRYDRPPNPFGYSPVFLTIVCAPEPTPVQGSPETETGWLESFGLLQRLIASSEAPALLEQRPPARLALSYGDGIVTSGKRSGTYGGTLTDPVGKQYGITCAHVAQTLQTVADTAGAHLGTVMAHTRLAALASGTICDPVLLPQPVPYPGNANPVNMLDLALIDLAVTPAAAPLGGIASRLTHGQDVTIHGSRKTIHCKLGSLALSYAVSDGASDYCFRDSIELLPQPLIPLGGALGVALTAMPVAGDSGAWVLTRDPAPLWAGVFFAEDGSRGFCVRSSWAHRWAEDELTVPLHV